MNNSPGVSCVFRLDFCICAFSTKLYCYNDTDSWIKFISISKFVWLLVIVLGREIDRAEPSGLLVWFRFYFSHLFSSIFGMFSSEAKISSNLLYNLSKCWNSLLLCSQFLVVICPSIFPALSWCLCGSVVSFLILSNRWLTNYSCIYPFKSPIYMDNCLLPSVS